MTSTLRARLGSIRVQTLLTASILGGAVMLALAVPTGAQASSGACITGPSNDGFATAMQLIPTAQGCAIASNADASNEDGEPLGGVGAGRTLWFTWTAPDGQSEIFDTFGSACGEDAGCTNGMLNTVVSVYTGTSLGDLQPATNVLNNNALVSTNLWNCKFQFWQSCFQIVNPTPGQTYYLQVDDFGDTGGTVEVNWRRPPVAPHAPTSDPPFQQPGNVVDSPTPTFHLEDSGATYFICWIDQDTIRVFEDSNCPQDFTTPFLPDGDYTFGYQTPDGATGLPGSPTEIDFTVDTTPDDTTPPAITPHVSGPQGLDGWFTGDVSISWTVADEESEVSSQSGCDPLTIATDTSGTTLTCSATSAGGTASESVTVKRDVTAPTTTITGAPDPQTSATAGTFTFSADESPVTFTCTLDGATVPCHSGQPYTGLGVGTHTFVVYATDAAGNAGVALARVWEIVPPPGCNLKGHVHGNQNFHTTFSGKKSTVHVEVNGDCDKDKKTGRIYLHNAKVKVELSGGANRLIDAKQRENNPRYGDISGITLTPATVARPASAVFRGTWQGISFTVALTDGGKPNRDDTLQVSYPGFPTQVLKAPHQNVHIEWH